MHVNLHHGMRSKSISSEFSTRETRTEKPLRRLSYVCKFRRRSYEEAQLRPSSFTNSLNASSCSYRICFVAVVVGQPPNFCLWAVGWTSCGMFETFHRSLSSRKQRPQNLAVLLSLADTANGRDIQVYVGWTGMASSSSLARFKTGTSSSDIGLETLEIDPQYAGSLGFRLGDTVRPWIPFTYSNVMKKTTGRDRSFPRPGESYNSCHGTTDAWRLGNHRSYF